MALTSTLPSSLKTSALSLTLVSAFLFFLLTTPKSSLPSPTHLSNFPLIPGRLLLGTSNSSSPGLTRETNPSCFSIETESTHSSNGIIDYYFLHFCLFDQNPLHSIPALSLLILLYFYILIKTAQTHFSTVTTKLSCLLNLSPSMGAVTLLALGNGAPDVFASVAAVRGGQYRTGFSAILSAGTFVSAFVVGFVAIYAAPFAVDPGSFVRDVLFYLIGASFLFYVYLSGEIFIWQAVGFVGFYLFFVGFVFWMDLGIGGGGNGGGGGRRGKNGGGASEVEKLIATKDCEIGETEENFEVEKQESSGFYQVCGMIPKVWELPVSFLLKLTIPQTSPSEWNSRIEMDHHAHGQGGVGNGSQLPYGSNLYHPNQIAGAPNMGNVVTSVGANQPVGAQVAQHQLAYKQIHQQQQQQLQEQLQNFWANQFQDIDKVTDFKNHSLPLARIKKIMKADEDVRMISAEAPVVFARACEMFILELTLRSWNHTEENKRRTLQKNDIAAAITRTDIFDFLVDIVPREDLKDEVLGSIPRGSLLVGGPAESFPYGYMPAAPHMPQFGAPGMIMGKPVMDPALYAQQPPNYMARQGWPQGSEQQQQQQQQQSPSGH